MFVTLDKEKTRITLNCVQHTPINHAKCYFENPKIKKKNKLITTDDARITHQPLPMPLMTVKSTVRLQLTYHPSFSWRLLSQWPSPHYDSRWVVCDCLRHLRYISIWAEACRATLVIIGEERLTSCNLTLQENTLDMAFISLPFTPKLMFSVLKIMPSQFYHSRTFNIFFVTHQRTEI